MDSARREAAVKRLERSSHTAFIHSNTLYVWGGYQVRKGGCWLPVQVVAGQDVVLPSSEICLCDLDSGKWECKEITGESPTGLSGFCGSNINSTLYIFGGCDSDGYSNQMFSVDVAQPCFSWTRVADTKGVTPSPRDNHSCWVHRGRLIYFGGYGCKTVAEAQNTSSSSFIVEEMSWAMIGNTLFRCWGWNNEVCVFDTRSSTWSAPATRGPAPSPRGCHASSILGNKGYITGGVETEELDIFCLDLETWTWSRFDNLPCVSPLGRFMHTMNFVSDQTLFVYGGLGMDGKTLNDAWLFNTQKGEWTKVKHPHEDKPRVCHTACLGSDGDVVVFGGNSDFCVLVDSVSVMRAPKQHHCRDVLIFQTQPYSLCRLCEDLISRNSELFRLDLLPSKLHKIISRKAARLSAMKLTPTA
ncbi:kelch domain-containing protein 1-like isoform X1 [Poecilia latipinna]|uniref:kelch domain-containing protein 1-like isoform X1 n=1 Tax=Poecilia latipinna TaxID=48699 RepID=UPI00072DD31F|nr:PREDICTED: kelch domain-containing protein 1-like isoform X1 [Poecilia latipinna]